MVNRLTVEGQVLHRKAHGEDIGPRGGGRSTARGNVRTIRGLLLLSEKLGIAGKADVVEFRKQMQDGRMVQRPFTCWVQTGITAWSTTV